MFSVTPLSTQPMLGKPGFKSELGLSEIICISYYVTSKKKKKNGAVFLNSCLLDSKEQIHF